VAAEAEGCAAPGLGRRRRGRLVQPGRAGPRHRQRRVAGGGWWAVPNGTASRPPRQSRQPHRSPNCPGARPLLSPQRHRWPSGAVI